MPAASLPVTFSHAGASYRDRRSTRERAVSLALALGAVALLILMLLRLGLLPAPPPTARTVAKVFNLDAGEENAAPQPRQARKAAARAAPKPAAATPPTPPPPVPPPVPRPATETPAPAMLNLDLGSSDIGKVRGAATGAAEGDATGDSVAPYGPGAGPGGAKLYNAEWYREPPPNVLELYLKRAPPPGYATIACRTIADYHVENCREVDEEPRGSGVARALRQAAWQFQVRPPRLGGKPIIGAWVRIRFIITERGAQVM